MIDLHTHSSYSDGTLSPAELVALATLRGISVLALTDHDTLAGLPPAMEAARQAGIELIPGVELSTEVDDHEVHILGYFVDPDDPRLAAALADLAEQRRLRTRRFTEKLTALGLPVPYSRVEAIAGDGTVGRPHVARAMIELGYVDTIGEAFDRYLAAGRPAFVPRVSANPDDAVRLLRTAGAVPVLAHPLSTGDPEGMVTRLIPHGLLGIEVYYSEYAPAVHSELRSIADRFDLIPTGGSDFHGPNFKEGRELGRAPVPADTGTKLRARWRAMPAIQS